MICVLVYLLVFTRNLLVHLAEKILLLQPLTFGGDYPPLSGNICKNLAPAKLFTKHNRPVLAHTVQLENALCQINAYDGNFRHRGPLLLAWLQHSSHLMPSGGGSTISTEPHSGEVMHWNWIAEYGNASQAGRIPKI